MLWLYIMVRNQDEKVDTSVIKHVIQQNQARILTSVDDEDVQLLYIRRSHLLSDAIRQFSKHHLMSVK